MRDCNREIDVIKDIIKESDEIVSAFNDGLLTAHQTCVSLDHLGTRFMYTLSSVTDKLTKTMHPLFGHCHE